MDAVVRIELFRFKEMSEPNHWRIVLPGLPQWKARPGWKKWKVSSLTRKQSS